MKRFLVISLSVLLLLPVLLVPCFAVTDYRFTYQSFSGNTATFLSDSNIPSGRYIMTAYIDIGEVLQAAITDPFTLPVLSSDPVTLSVNGQFALPMQPVVDRVFYLTFSQGESSTVLSIIIDSAGPEMYAIMTPVSDEPLSGQLLVIAQTAIDWCAEIAAVIVSRPLLLATVGIFFVGGCIAIFSRFLSRD